MLTLSLNLGEVTHARNKGGGVVAETAALIAQMSVKPDGTQTARIDRLVRAGLQNGWWSKLDFLYVGAQHDRQAARLNWTAPGSFALTENGSPNWLAYRGYLGGSSVQYLGTGFTPSLHAQRATQNNICAGGYSLTDANENAPMIGIIGSSTGRAVSLYPRGSGNMTARANDTAGSATIGAVADSLGFFMVERTSSASRLGYKGNTLVGTVSASSGGLADGEITLIGNTTQFSTRRECFHFLGAALTTAERQAFIADMEVYLTSVGATFP
ncbi:MAG: hypothetical protein ACK4Y5_16505 [Acetobacteraceae bacterium]|jgi:hypothetical protein